MRVLVLSDSHGRQSAVTDAIEAQPAAHHIFFLGDKLEDTDGLENLYPDREFHKVSGNCDFVNSAPDKGTVTLCGKKIFYCHGHEFGVKFSADRLLSYGKACGADIILYGHTHTANTEYANGVYLVNPGSVGKDGRTYAFIDIDEKNTVPVIVRLT